VVLQGDARSLQTNPLVQQAYLGEMKVSKEGAPVH
jgi:hypothetical protein